MAIPGSPCLLLALLVLSLSLPSYAQVCSSESFSQNRAYVLCSTLPYLGGSIHWTYHPSNGTADIAYRAPQSSNGWVAWGLNPSGAQMPGVQALIAFLDTSGKMVVYASSISGYNNPTIADGKLSFPVTTKSAEYSNGVMTIYATIGLPGNNITQTYQVWQAGAQFSNGVPSAHVPSGDNILSKGRIDFLSGTSAASGGNSRLHRKNIHGVLNAISWGILLPVGAIIARYLKVFADPAWFYLHITCQVSAYIIGVAGWGLGLKLGSESVGITYDSHRDIGIALFTLATLQVFALLLRPKKDHKYRFYWNVYHHLVGYTVIILSVINIFKGFDILMPGSGWKHAYIAIIATLGGIALVLEVFTWAVFLKRRANNPEDKAHGSGNGFGGRV